MIEESVLIWMIVKEAAPDIIKAGGNPIEVNKVKYVHGLPEKITPSCLRPLEKV